MGCPRIVLLNVTTVTFIVIALCTHTYMYTCPAPFGADGLINKINLFNSTGVTESYIANTVREEPRRCLRYRLGASMLFSSRSRQFSRTREKTRDFTRDFPELDAIVSRIQNIQQLYYISSENYSLKSI